MWRYPHTRASPARAAAAVARARFAGEAPFGAGKGRAVTTVFFATNRARANGAGGVDVFGHEADSRLWLGTAEVATGGGPEEARVVHEFSCTGRDDFAPPDGSCGAVLDAFLRTAAEQRAIPLLSIHGFQYTFEDALARTGELVEFYGDYAGPAPVRLVPLLFTWPSLGMFSRDAYRRDRASAESAGRALGRLLVALAERLQGEPPRLRLLAHSMGVFALGHGVQAACASPEWAGGPPRFLDSALLAAGDIDNDALCPGGPLAPLAGMAAQVVATVFNGDKVAEWFGSGHGPASSLAAKGPPLDAALPDNVFALDCNNLIERGLPVPQDQVEPNWIGHQYYRNQPAVRSHLTRLLGGERAPLPGWERYWPALAGGPTNAGGVRNAPFYWYGY